MNKPFPKKTAVILALALGTGAGWVGFKSYYLFGDWVGLSFVDRVLWAGRHLPPDMGVAVWKAAAGFAGASSFACFVVWLLWQLKCSYPFVFSNRSAGPMMAKGIAATMLFAALGHHVYDYYVLLRWVVCGVASFSAYQALQLKRSGWIALFLTAALMFNPFLPVRFERGTWGPVDLSMGVLFLVAVPMIDFGKPSNW